MDLIQFVEALKYEPTSEEDALEFFIPYIYETGNNSLWQLKLIDKMMWTGGLFEKSYADLALRIISRLEDDHEIMESDEVKDFVINVKEKAVKVT